MNIAFYMKREQLGTMCRRTFLPSCSKLNAQKSISAAAGTRVVKHSAKFGLVFDTNIS